MYKNNLLDLTGIVISEQDDLHSSPVKKQNMLLTVILKMQPTGFDLSVLARRYRNSSPVILWNLGISPTRQNFRLVGQHATDLL